MPFEKARRSPLTSPRAVRGCSVAALLISGLIAGAPEAAAETRTLSIYHTHTRESITVTFKRNGRYDDGALSRLNQFLRDWRNDEATKMDPRLFDIIWEVYQEVGASRPVEIISAYRSPATNSMLRRRSRGVAQFSQHMLGKAIDFNIPDAPLEKIRNAGLRQQRGGVGFYPSSGSPFVHLDVGSVRHWPRLSPDALARVFPDGRTVHIPSNGQPLRNYDLAMQDVARRGATPSQVALAAAREAGNDAPTVQGATSSLRRSWFARLFGANTDEQDDEREARRDRGVKPREAAPARETRVAAVPMPRPRPDSGEALVARATTPAQIVHARGLWSASETMAAADAAPARPQEPKLVWQVGPQPASAATADATQIAKRTPMPRPRREAVASASPETTASLPAWPIAEAKERVDRVPSELVMAYAAQSMAPEPITQSAAPMGALRAQAPAAPGPRPRATRRAPQQPAVQSAGAALRLVGNPWLRGMMIAPSMQAAMDVTVLGPPNYLALAPLMHKPAQAVANGFAHNANFGLSSSGFGGASVAFVPTIEFVGETVGLN